MDDYEIDLLIYSVIRKYKAGVDRQKLLEQIERLAFFNTIVVYKKRTSLALLSLDVLTNRHTVKTFFQKIEENIKEVMMQPDFHEAMKNVGRANGYYGWNSIRYFMFEYEQHLKLKTKSEREKLRWVDEDSDGESYELDYRSVEHVYPQSAKDAYWRNAFSKYDTKQKNKLKNSLGNLLPVSSPKNSSLSNKSFTLKKGDAKAQVGYRYGCFSEIQVSEEGDWNAISIVKRGIYLLNFMEKRWRIPLGDFQRKLEILGVEFVLEVENIAASDFADS